MMECTLCFNYDERVDFKRFLCIEASFSKQSDVIIFHFQWSVFCRKVCFNFFSFHLYRVQTVFLAQGSLFLPLRSRS